MTIEQIKRRNAAAGYHWFEPATLRFFRSRVSSIVYSGPGGTYFVSSEQFADHRGYVAPRRYTVRQFNPETGAVETVGQFNDLPRSTAHRWAAKLAGSQTT